jgi:hypothetical protein
MADVPVGHQAQGRPRLFHLGAISSYIIVFRHPSSYFALVVVPVVVKAVEWCNGFPRHIQHVTNTQQLDFGLTCFVFVQNDELREKELNFGYQRARNQIAGVADIRRCSSNSISSAARERRRFRPTSISAALHLRMQDILLLCYLWLCDSYGRRVKEGLRQRRWRLLSSRCRRPPLEVRPSD